MRTILGVLILVCAIEPASASVTLDFAGFADTNGERGYGFGDQITVNSVDVKLFAWNTTTMTALTNELLGSTTFSPGGAVVDGAGPYNDGPYAYLDKGNAGMGVGQKLTASKQVNPSNDDNVTGTTTSREVLGIQFMDNMIVEQFVMRDAGHHLIGSGNVEITFDDGANWSTYAISPLSGSDGLVDFGSGISVIAGNRIGLAWKGTQFYLSSAEVTPVPEASSIVIWATLGLIGLAVSRRRSRVGQ